MAIVGLLLTGCTSQPSTESAAVPAAHEEERPPGAWEFDEAASAEVDREAGTIVLPLDQFQLTPEEMVVVKSAATLDIFLCARDKGVEEGSWEPYEVSHTPPRDQRRYGVWVRQYAEKYAYDLPPAPAVHPNNVVEGAMDIYLSAGRRATNSIG